MLALINDDYVDHYME